MRCGLRLLLAVSRRLVSVISCGASAVPLNSTSASDAAVPCTRSKNTNCTVIWLPFQPVFRSISEKCESAFARLIDMRAITSMPSAAPACTSKRLYCMTRAW